MRWSDLDSYGHVNNVKFYDYVQQARIALINETVHWPPETVWMVARQDVQYRAPLDFRLEPYEVATWVTAIGTRSFTLAAEIRDPGSGTRLRDRGHRRRRLAAADHRPARGPVPLAGPCPSLSP